MQKKEAPTNPMSPRVPSEETPEALSPPVPRPKVHAYGGGSSSSEAGD